MTHENFAYWLQGYNEISGGQRPSEQGWEVIKDHLELTFNKVTPTRTRQIYDPKNLPVPNTQTYCKDIKSVKDVADMKGYDLFSLKGDTVPVLTKGIVGLERKRNCGSAEITYHHLPLSEQILSTSC